MEVFEAKVNEDGSDVTFEQINYNCEIIVDLKDTKKLSLRRKDTST